MASNPLLNTIKDFAAQSVIRNLLESGVSANYIDTIIDILTRSVTTGAVFDDVISQLDDYVIGKAAQGALSQYVKQVSSDTLNQFVAEYQQIVSEDIGLEFIKYTGNIIRDSRQFCVKRVNKHYHINEVKEWVTNEGDAEGNPVPHGEKWAGRIAGTNASNIMINRGGWHCRHQCVFVNTRYVPKDVLKRNIENGNWKPTEKQLVKFGLK